MRVPAKRCGVTLARRYAFVLALTLTAAPAEVFGQTGLSANTPPRTVVQGGVERNGLFLGVDVNLTPTWFVGYSQTDRFDQHPRPGPLADIEGSRTYAAVLGYRPWRWLSAYAGPLAGDASTYRLVPAGPTTHASFFRRERVWGAALGSELRLHDRPYRFYSLRAHYLELRGDRLIQRSSLQFGFGMGVTF